MSSFPETMDRQLATERDGEAERQCRHSEAKGDRKGYGHKSSARKRAAKRLAR